jgi:hypothetical protein
MGLFDFLQRKSPSGATSAPASAPGEPIYVVPLAARKITAPGELSKETYMFYAFLFDASAEAAVARLHREVRDEGFEFLELTGKVLVTSIPDWTEFVSDKFDWTKDALPTAQQLADDSRGVVHYSPKIIRL